MRQLGKVGQQWVKVRREWLRLHPANHEGYYVCALCRRWIPAEEIEVDHIIPRSARPDLRFDFDNLQAMCHWCNTKKGSRKLPGSSY